jgi:glycosyltransferase involved in cell wall biosynthesis
MTTVSVAVATFNGEKHLLAQLESLARQSRRPDEIVVSDDGSSDGTLETVRAWARSAPIPVRLSVNAERLGYSANFETALRLATGDIVFLCDQDDVWLPTKIARVLEAFARDPTAVLVLNDQYIADEDLRPGPRTSFEVLRRRGYNPYGQESFVSGHGCCMAVRRSFLDLALPIPHDLTGHDVWLARFSAVLGRQSIVPEPLQLWRRHAEAVSLKRSLFSPRHEWQAFARSREARRESLVRKLRFLEALSERLRAPSSPTDDRDPGRDLARGRIDREAEALARRIRLYDRPWLARRTGAVRLLLRGDYRSSRGWRSFLADFLKA